MIRRGAQAMYKREKAFQATKDIRKHVAEVLLNSKFTGKLYPQDSKFYPQDSKLYPKIA